MPYLLSLLPPQSDEEKLNPIPLIAKLPSLPKTFGSLYINVLGGSQSRGGIALDPLVSTGRLSVGSKVEFGQLRQVYLPTYRPAQQGIHIQLEVLSHASRRFKTGWKKLGLKGKDRTIQVGFKKQQRWSNLPDILANRRLDYQGTRRGLFSAGSEGGFLVGERGVVPWLCRTRGSRVALQVTPHKWGERRIPRAKVAKHEVDIQAYLSRVKRHSEIRKALKERNLIITKKVVFLDDKSWTTIPVLRKRESRVTPKMRAGQAKMEAHNREQQRPALLRRQEQKKEFEMQKYNRRLRMWNARTRLRKLQQFKKTKFLHPDSKIFAPKTSDTMNSQENKRQKTSKSQTLDALSATQAAQLKRLESLSPQMQRLLASDPELKRLVSEGQLNPLRFFGLRRSIWGPRRFAFRARNMWTEYRPSGFRRSGHRPGGFKIWKERGEPEKNQSMTRRNMDRVSERKITVGAQAGESSPPAELSETGETNGVDKVAHPNKMSRGGGVE
jgi:hypothetical protein